MTTTRSLRIEGTATALSSITHLEGTAGTLGLFRREKVVQPDGTVAKVPVVSGNSLRGVLRDYCAEVFVRAVGLDRGNLPAPLFDLLFSGGALAKAGAGHVLSARQLVRVREMVPMVSLFGGSGAGRIIEGKLSVLKLTPVCAETVHLLPDGLSEGQAPAMRDLLQAEEFTRRDDAKRDRLAALVEGVVPVELTTGDAGGAATAATAVTDTDAEVPDVFDRTQQMRYGTETVAAGTRFHWGMRLSHVTDAEVSLLAHGIDAWVGDGAHIGGRAATGHGRLRLDVHQWERNVPAVTVGEALVAPGRDPLAEHVRLHGDAITETLGWFT